MNRIIVLCGFSASGKDTISQYLTDHYGYKMVISHTSRPMRKNEREGNPYFFISEKDFIEKFHRGEFIEHRIYPTQVNGKQETWYYGIAKDTIDLAKYSYVAVVDTVGLRHLKKVYGKKIISFFIDVNEPIRRKRCMENREDFDIEEWTQRFKSDRLVLNHRVIQEEIDYAVKNDDFNQCIQEILQRIEENRLGKTTAIPGC